MKVVQINANFDRGSIGRTTAETHRELLALGHESYVFTAEDERPADHVFRIGTPLDHKVHALLSRATGLQGYFSRAATRALLARLEAIGPDVVHLRNLHANYLHVPLLLDYLGQSDTATVITLHDLWPLTGKCCHYTHVGCERWRTGCGSCPALAFDNKSWLFDRTRRVWADKRRLYATIPRLAVVGNSEWTTQQARESMAGGARVVRRIYNWIDTTRFRPVATERLRALHGLGADDLVVLGVSQTWKRRKGLDVFCRLAEALPEARVLLVGAMAAGEGLPANVVSVRPTSSVDALSAYYTLATVFVNPSRQETFGKVSAEALCCGTPLVVNRATANPELVGPGCGYVVDDNNIARMAEAIRTIHARGKKAYSEACLRFAHEHFGKAQNLGAYIRLYEELSAR